MTPEFQKSKIWFNHLQVRAMLDCNKDCWLNHPVARLLAEGELDDYSRPHEEDTSGPRCLKKVCVRIKLEAPKKVYSIRLDVDKGHKGENNRFSCDRRPTVARLIQV